MIHVFVGTNAQLIKMAPIMRELDALDIAYNFIDAGQHIENTEEFVNVFGLRNPDVSLRSGHHNITTVPQSVGWFLQSLWLWLFGKSKIRSEVFRGQGGICLVHGDTLTTLISTLFAKRAGIAVAHVEAGLRSHDLLHPFPEEMIRIIVMRLADVLFAPGEQSYRNLIAMKVRGQLVNTQAHTVVDAVAYISGKASLDLQELPQRYVVVSVHRAEMVFSARRLELLLDTLVTLPTDLTILFVIHAVTLKQLKAFGMYERLQKMPNVRILPPQNYADFHALLQRAQFLVTDGGSIQEESGILNIPCLILRKKTEREIGPNAMLSQYNLDRIRYFVEHYQEFRGAVEGIDHSPSRQIVEFVRRWEETHPA